MPESTGNGLKTASLYTTKMYAKIFGIKCKNLFFFLQIMISLSLAFFSFTKYNSEKPENKL